MPANPTRKKLPKRCACGGKLVYSFGPGDYIASYCERCTPVVKVKLREVTNG